MNRKSFLLIVQLLTLTSAAGAQVALPPTAPSRLSTSNLPARNLQIEVRQIGQDESASAATRLGGSVQLRPGASSAQWELAARAQADSRSADARQQVWVLNGRRAGIALHNSVPLRLVQTFVHNGVMTIMSGTVLMESGTGFDATPRWDGGAQVELELSASQGQGTEQASTASTATWIVVPLGEWVTVAQSEQQSMAASTGLGGTASGETRSRGMQVQVRVTLP